MTRYFPRSLNHIIGGIITMGLAVFFPATVILELSGAVTVL